MHSGRFGFKVLTWFISPPWSAYIIRYLCCISTKSCTLLGKGRKEPCSLAAASKQLSKIKEKHHHATQTRLPTSSSFRFNAMILIFGCTAAVDRSDTRNRETSAEAQGERYQYAHWRASGTGTPRTQWLCQGMRSEVLCFIVSISSCHPFIPGRVVCCFLQLYGWSLSNLKYWLHLFSSPSFSSLSDLQNAKWVQHQQLVIPGKPLYRKINSGYNQVNIRLSGEFSVSHTPSQLWNHTSGIGRKML